LIFYCEMMLTKIKQQFVEGKTLLQFTFLRATGQCLTMAVPLIIAKFFSPELFGRYSLAKMIIFFFTMLSIGSLQTPFIVFANEERAKNSKINKAFSAQCVFLILSLCTFLVLILLLNKPIAAFAKISRADLFFVLFGFIGIALKTFLCNLFMAMGQRTKNALTELTYGLLSVSLIFILHFVDRINLRTVFMVYPASTVILIAILFKSIDFKLLLPFKFEKEYFRKMLDFAKWVALGATAVYFIDWGDNLVLRCFVSMEAIGVYNLGYQLFKGIIILIHILGPYFLPFLSENINNTIKTREYLWSKRPKIFIVGMITVAIIYFLGPYLLNAIYCDVYRESMMVLRILLIAAVIFLYNVFYIPFFNALKKYKVLQISNVLQVLLNIILDLVLVPRMGIYGAAVGTVFAYLCRAVILEMYFRIKLRKDLKL